MPAPSPSPRPHRRRRWWRAVGIVAAVGLLVLLGCVGWIRVRTTGQTYAEGDVPPAPVALVLGAGLADDGQPGRYLTPRLELARRLWASGRVKALLVSGNAGPTSHAEVDAMHDWLLARGVPAKKVVRDDAGFDTYDSCVRAVRVFGVRDAIVVTQAFHLPRALFLCRGAGMRAVGVAATLPDGAGVGNQLRELPAGVKAVAEDLFRPDPDVLGPPDPGLGRAVAG